MINEQELIFQHKLNDIYKILYDKGSYEESNIIIKYYGNKKQIPLEFENNNLEKNEEDDEINNSLDPEDSRNYLLFIKYQDIYIGAISIDDFSRRENFGLNIYSNVSFYIGRWKENMKNGIGFLKINENVLYIGNFKDNQFNGFGILLDKNKKNLFYGNFDNGVYDEGIFYNMEKQYFYRGKIKDGKKDGELCTFFDAQNGYLFFGEIKNDEFNKGYVFYVQIMEDKQKNGDVLIKFNNQKIIFFDGLGENKKRFYNEKHFIPEFYSKLQDIGNSIFQADFNIKDQDEDIIKFFDEIENIPNINNYFIIDNYNQFGEEQLENDFIHDFYKQYDTFINGQKNLNLQEYKEILEQPEISE